MNATACKGLGIWLSLALLAAGGCTVTEPVALEADFGESVRQMVRAQTLYPAAADDPDPNPVRGLVGEKGDAVLDAYRKDVSRPTEVNNVINIAVGNGK